MFLVFRDWSGWGAYVASSTKVDGKTLNGLKNRTRTCDGADCDGNVGIDKVPCVCDKAFDLKTSTDCPASHFTYYSLSGKGNIICVISYALKVLTCFSETLASRYYNSTSDHRKCEQDCREHTDCVGYVWASFADNWQDSFCYLKNTQDK